MTEEFKKQFTCLGENAQKYMIFVVPIEKEVTGIDKNGGEITKIYLTCHHLYLTCYNLLIARDIWQTHYQILSINFLKEFIELNVNLILMIKNVKHADLNISVPTVSLNTKILKLIIDKKMMQN